ncbi:hypothetical protein N7520_005674 [Penicillium odoratum]|uniref:uncharacterized protein n=1 Tax=Penicillium odoratum TaxID=1167516 RepID=UPI0025467A2E|nr:uncharacterized protein N7520_005674 [Penicillium odoratum]KAJ5758518.1 hypothetical protein N7520_005674 [Penicillium odoratum]
MGIPKLQVGMAGLGRVSKFHATNFLQRPCAELVAAFSPDPTEIAWGRVNLEPHRVTLYDNYNEMLKHPGLQAVAIGTATSVHADQVIKAIDVELHVLCEKPLSIHIDLCKAAVNAAKKKSHLKMMRGFSRRFDDSYREAYRKVEQGLIGRPSIIRSQTSVQTELKKQKDCDNSLGIVEFQNGKIAKYYCSRMMAHGQEDTTEIIGTEGKLARSHVNYYHGGGITREVPSNFRDRFGPAFVQKANDVTAACLDNTPLPMKLSNAVKAVGIGAYLQEALVTGKQIHFDEIGRRIEKAQL